MPAKFSCKILTMLGARRHVEVHLLSPGIDQSHHQLLDSVWVMSGEWSPVGGVHPHLSSLVSPGVEHLQLARLQAGDELQHRVTHAVQGGGGQLVIVVHVVTIALALQLERLSQDLAQYGGQELVVGYVLYLGAHHLPGLLVQRLLVPVRVDSLQQRGQSVVFSHQHCHGQ